MRPAHRSRQRGIGLIEGLISLAILSFGVLGLARFQLGVLKQTSDAQQRAAAAELASRLMAYVRVDVTHAACYTLPQTGTCTSTVASNLAAAWATEAAGRKFTTATASMPVAGRFQTSLAWTSRAFADTRTLEATTDVRP